MSIDLYVAVAQQLPSLTPAGRKAEPKDYVVEASLQPNQKVLPRHSAFLRSFPEQVSELALLEAIHPLHLLLLTKLKGIV
jgi:hypothetical protein